MPESFPTHSLRPRPDRVLAAAHGDPAGEHLQIVLGPAPSDPGGRTVWCAIANEIEARRDRQSRAPDPPPPANSAGSSATADQTEPSGSSCGAQTRRSAGWLVGNLPGCGAWSLTSCFQRSLSGEGPLALGTWTPPGVPGEDDTSVEHLHIHPLPVRSLVLMTSWHPARRIGSRMKEGWAEHDRRW